MIGKVLACLIASSAVFAAWALYASASEFVPTQMQHHLLDTSLKQSGDFGPYVLLANRSGALLCVDSNQFDTAHGNLVLVNGDGRSVPQNSFAEPAPNFLAGADFNQAYFLILPGQKREIDIDFKNFQTTKSKYRYQLMLRYYRCEDMAKAAQNGGGKPIEMFSSVAQGVIDLSQDGQ